MAFWKSRLKRESPAPQADDFPTLYNGMKVEVLTPTGVLIFEGKLRVLNNETLEVRAESGGFLPRAIYNQQVRLQGVQRDGRRFALNGAVGPNAPTFWRIERLRTLQSYENRNFFRQTTGIEAWVYSTTSSQGQRYPCKVLDISAGGARVVTQKLFPMEGTFQLELALLPGGTPLTLNCKVKRIRPHSKPGSPGRKFEYGCQFLNVPAKEQERMIQDIFALQRNSIRAWQGR